MVKNWVIFCPEPGGFSSCPVRDLLKHRLGRNPPLFPRADWGFPLFSGDYGAAGFPLGGIGRLSGPGAPQDELGQTLEVADQGHHEDLDADFGQPPITSLG